MKGQILFNLLFWIPNSFRTFHDYARGVIPFLASSDDDWFFMNNFLALKNRVALKLFIILKYFLSFRTFEQLVLALKKSVPWIHCIKYTFFIIQNFEPPALDLKNIICPEIFHCIEIFFIFQDFWATWAYPENRVCSEFFKPRLVTAHQ